MSRTVPARRNARALRAIVKCSFLTANSECQQPLPLARRALANVRAVCVCHHLSASQYLHGVVVRGYFLLR
eukprot:3994260-Pleurochrysis_carterae.AAC.4